MSNNFATDKMLPEIVFGSTSFDLPTLKDQQLN